MTDLHKLAYPSRDEMQLAVDYSRNFAEAKVGIGATEKEHILGLCALLERALAAQPAQAGEVALPMETAPRDGTIVRLLVDFDEHATDDGPEPSWTIGAIMAVGEPDAEFQFAGWCWDHDHWTEGKGTPVGWLPFHGDARAAAAASRPATAVPEGLGLLVDALEGAMIESIHGEGFDLWAKNRGKLRNRLPESVGAIIVKMRAILSSAPQPPCEENGHE